MKLEIKRTSSQLLRARTALPRLNLSTYMYAGIMYRLKYEKIIRPKSL